MQRVEEDVLSEIFALAISQSEGRTTLRDAPLNLSHTCRRWRELLLSNGRFWTHLDCFNSRTYDHRLASLWPERSRDAIMNVRIGPHHDGSQESKDRDCERLLEAVLRNQSRVGALKVMMMGSHEGEPMKLHDLSNLVSLELHHPFPFRGDSLLLSSTHALLHLPHLPEETQAIAPVLTKLTLTGVKEAEAQLAGVLAMLVHCHNLSEFALTTRRNRSVERRDEESEAPINCILEKLESFSYSTFSYGGFLRHIRAPSLRYICVMGIASWPPAFNEMYDDIRDFLADSERGPVVRSAHFFFTHIEEEAQLAILEALPGVTTLEAGFPRTNRVYRGLTLGGDGGELCPLLEYMEIHAPPKEGVRAMIDMLRSRFDESAKFRAVIATRPLEDDDAEELRAQVEIHRWISEGRLNGPRLPSTGQLYDRFVAARQGLRMRF